MIVIAISIIKSVQSVGINSLINARNVIANVNLTVTSALNVITGLKTTAIVLSATINSSMTGASKINVLRDVFLIW